MFFDLINSILPKEIARKRTLLTEHGDDITATVNLKTVLKGLPGAKVLYSEIPTPGHWVEPLTGLHISGFPLERWVNEPYGKMLVRLFSGQSFLSQDPVEQQRLDQLLNGCVEEVEKVMLSGYQHFLDRSDDLDAIIKVVTRRKRVIKPINVLAAIVAMEGDDSKVAQMLAEDHSNQITPTDLLTDILYLHGLLSFLVPALYRVLYLKEEPIYSRGKSYCNNAF